MLKAVLIVVIVAVVGYLVWERHFSQGGRIEAAYKACMKEFGGGTDKAAADAKSQVPKTEDPAAAIARSMGDALTSMLQGMGGAMCGAMKDACTRDFDGAMCQAALNRYK
ncbi:MAG: hypothetical protein U1F15_06815 [Burkholderiales bacterium]